MPRRLAMPRRLPFAPLVLLVTACGFPRPPDVVPDDARGSDADVAIDAPASSDARVPLDARPGTTIQVVGTGDDANDGITAPVKTLKRAIGLAAANDEITSIVLASGRYSTAGGETFPYTVPANVFIVGPAGGGAILAGSNTEPGMTLDTGALQDLELEDFSVAITSTGTAQLTNVRVRTGTLAVRAETGARLTVDNLDIAGTAGACAKGVSLTGGAQLVAATLATRRLGTTLDAVDQSTAEISKANLSGDRNCPVVVVRATTTGTLSLTDSLVDNGFGGAQFFAVNGQSAPRVTFTNTVLRNMKGNGILGGDGVTLTMVGGALSNNEASGFDGGGGLYTFTDVMIQGNGIGISHSGNATIAPALQTLKLRGCTVLGSSSVVYLDRGTFADLGTTSSPGNNTFLSVQSVGLYIGGGTAPRIDAIGNTWQPNVQGADASGKYPSSMPPVMGPVPLARGNYAIEQAGISLHL